ncbi:MAG: hypothetical protein LCI03_17215 [Actinobacteria bacterium]|nr:hypothetical protein [Actinomycetota bacterium]
MRAAARVAAATGAILVVATMGAASPAAAAGPTTPSVTWPTAAALTVKAHDVDGYRTVLKPSGVYVPKGKEIVSSVMTVKNSRGAALATNVTAYRAKPGVYTVYSTTSYRTRWAKWRTRLVTGEVTGFSTTNPCGYQSHVVGATTTQYSFFCSGFGRNPAGKEIYVGWTATVEVPNDGPTYSPAQGISPIDPYYAELVAPASVTTTWSEDYLDVWYSETTVGRSKRAVTVVANNTPYVTAAQYQALRLGMTPQKVAATLGQGGYFDSGYGIYRQYNAYNCFDKNGRYNGYTDSASHAMSCVTKRVFRLLYKSGKLYAWDYVDIVRPQP